VSVDTIGVGSGVGAGSGVNFSFLHDTIITIIVAKIITKFFMLFICFNCLIM
jgi:hypothetical protein